MAHQVSEGFYLNGAVVYIDDTVIYGKKENFPGNVGYGSRENGAFQCPSQSKCSFGMTSVGFLGHIFDEHGVHLSDKSARDSRYSYP